MVYTVVHSVRVHGRHGLIRIRVFRQVELDKGARQNGLKETEGGHDTDMGAHGATNQASPMRHRLRSSGAMEGQVRGSVLA